MSLRILLHSASLFEGTPTLWKGMVRAVQLEGFGFVVVSDEAISGWVW